VRAKRFKKIREKAKLYDVQVTEGLFGQFSPFYIADYITVLAYSPRQACKRAVKKGYGTEHKNCYEETTKTFGHFAVKKHSKSDFWRNVTYYGI